MGNTLIPIQDYKRIFNTIYSFLQSEDAKINHSCIYFSVIGSCILQKHYELNPKVYMGIAAYMLDDKQKNVLAFAEKDETQLFCSKNGFHAWIVVNDWIIDFTAPLFPSMLKNKYKNATNKSRMFQKPLSLMCSSAYDLAKNGDFFIYENIPFANEMMDRFAKQPYNIDIAEICCQWYRKPPLKMLGAIKVSNGAGYIKQVPLKSYEITGRW